MHAEDIREYLVEKFGAQPDEIKVKSAELDELGDENLLSELSKVRYIITKDALREGWDCPFAYILAVLSKTTAATALTQMIGRVLRQPEAETDRPAIAKRVLRLHFDQEVRPPWIACGEDWKTKAWATSPPRCAPPAKGRRRIPARNHSPAQGI